MSSSTTAWIAMKWMCRLLACGAFLVLAGCGSSGSAETSAGSAAEGTSVPAQTADESSTVDSTRPPVSLLQHCFADTQSNLETDQDDDETVDDGLRYSVLGQSHMALRLPVELESAAELTKEYDDVDTSLNPTGLRIDDGSAFSIALRDDVSIEPSVLLLRGIDEEAFEAALAQPEGIAIVAFAVPIPGHSGLPPEVAYSSSVLIETPEGLFGTESSCRSTDDIQEAAVLVGVDLEAQSLHNNPDDLEMLLSTVSSVEAFEQGRIARTQTAWTDLDSSRRTLSVDTGVVPQDVVDSLQAITINVGMPGTWEGERGVLCTKTSQGWGPYCAELAAAQPVGEGIFVMVRAFQFDDEPIELHLAAAGSFSAGYPEQTVLLGQLGVVDETVETINVAIRSDFQPGQPLLGALEADPNSVELSWS